MDELTAGLVDLLGALLAENGALRLCGLGGAFGLLLPSHVLVGSVVGERILTTVVVV
eukprot:SAG31_NODE_330_length_17593_cov_4.817891_5_plen_57_part_00